MVEERAGVKVAEFVGFKPVSIKQLLYESKKLKFHKVEEIRDGK
jgi:hypothetical protein